MLRDLGLEHQKIREMLEVLSVMAEAAAEGAPPPPKELESLVEFFGVYLERFHHGKEEELLFPALNQTGRVDQGGPYCGLFMDYWITRNPIPEIEARVARAGIGPVGPTEGVREILGQVNCMRIPLQEHAAGHACLEVLRGISRAHSGGGEFPKADFSAAVRLYCELLHLHIRKEDECLFVLAASALGDEKLALLSEREGAIRRRIGEQMITSALDTAEALSRKYRKSR
ncbi:MAG: hemerythrin domain-containing protein [Bdellovibrionales bacterium]|nr:hemerythrin domain-containing protein [Bdellovibrionales bacterium]